MHTIFTAARRETIGASVILGAFQLAGCAAPAVSPERPKLTRPQAITGESLELHATQVEPMYTELLPIDLPTVARVALAQNVDIRLARTEVLRSRGGFESAVGGAFPVIAPLALFEHVEGSVRATEGNIVNVGFNVFQPSVAVQWIVNPGEVVYEIIAAKKRLYASEHFERAAQMGALRLAAVQFYDLVLAQAQIAAAYRSVEEAEELLRINELATRTGTGVPADEMRARAQLAVRQQELKLAMNALHRASLALGLTLQLEDPTVTLLPKLEELPPLTLVSDEYGIEELLGYAILHRPELHAVRELIEAAQAERGATWWRGFGPQVGLAYQYGGITGHSNNTARGEGLPSNLILNPASPTGAFSANPFQNGLIREGLLRGSRRLARDRDETFAFSDQQRASASIAARWSLSAFGELKAASAREQQRLLEAEQALLEIRTEVVDAAQASKLYRALIDLAHQQEDAAEEALRLVTVNIAAGTMTTLDTLQAQDAAAQARLRHAEALVRYNEAQINLLAAVGLLDESSLLR